MTEQEVISDLTKELIPYLSEEVLNKLLVKGLQSSVDATIRYQPWLRPRDVLDQYYAGRFVGGSCVTKTIYQFVADEENCTLKEAHLKMRHLYTRRLYEMWFKEYLASEPLAKGKVSWV